MLSLTNVFYLPRIPEGISENDKSKFFNQYNLDDQGFLRLLNLFIDSKTHFTHFLDNEKSSFVKKKKIRFPQKKINTSDS